ncbi:calcium:cation antiporter [Stappia sp.]|jgi:Ca2+:H+ antiporter|uniref:calcium:proton antiporter n=1 Tax=Stappia sp. TaxID=1870903 RepID=UPI003A9A2764
MTGESSGTTKAVAGAPGHPVATWKGLASLALAFVLVAVEQLHLVAEESVFFIVPAVPLLIISVFGAVHYAEIVSARFGQPFGSIVLATAVTVIEVSLIISMMMAPSEGDTTIARDTVFATLMLVLNGIIGLSLLIGGIRHKEQLFRSHGAIAAFSVLGALAVLALALPNYTTAVAGPFYSPVQLIFVAVVSAILYATFLFAQTVRHRADFVDMDDEILEGTHMPTKRQAVLSGVLLVIALVAVILLAEALAPGIEHGVASIGFADAFVGVIIAAIVLLPEALTALRAAADNRLQTSLNVSTGSALASIGLSIPAIAIASLVTHKNLTLGLDTEHVLFLALTLFIGTLTLASGRTTIVQGAVHLVIFGSFLLVAAVP